MSQQPGELGGALGLSRRKSSEADGIEHSAVHIAEKVTNF